MVLPGADVVHAAAPGAQSRYPNLKTNWDDQILGLVLGNELT